MSEPRDPNAPDFSTLLRLRASLPGMVKGIQQGKIGGAKAKGMPTVRVPRTFCLLCDAVFNWTYAKKGQYQSIAEGFCEKCEKKLKDHIAVKDDEGRCVFVKITDELRETLHDITDGKADGVTGRVVLELDKTRFQMILAAHAFELPELPNNNPPPDEPANPQPGAAGPALN